MISMNRQLEILEDSDPEKYKTMSYLKTSKVPYF